MLDDLFHIGFEVNSKFEFLRVLIGITIDFSYKL